MNCVAIIPAYNEAPRIAAVIAPIIASGAVTRVLVVDDGSTDDTARVAREAGADVVRTPRNGGKGGAMRFGVQQTTEPAIAFFDADLIGLRPDHVRALVETVTRDGCAMSCGLRDYGEVNNRLQLALPPITGERVVLRSLLETLPADAWKGFGIEAGMNEACKRGHFKYCVRVLDGMTIVPKWHKVGIRQGLIDAGKMAHEVLTAMRDARARYIAPPVSASVIDCFVPAHNEAPRIAAVLRPLLASKLFRRVTVLDDGSSDGTSDVARAQGAEVLRLSPNRGKGGAMREGFAQSDAPWIAFFDADLLNLSKYHLESMVEIAKQGEDGMILGTLVEHENIYDDLYAMYGLCLTGQRLVHRSVLERLPAKFWDGYGIEVAMDEACSRMGYSAVRILLRGLGCVKQGQKKGGFASGGVEVAKIFHKALETAARVKREVW